jgi:hypothetical protein
MKNRELIEMLKSFDPEAEVILQKDSEGNGYSPLSGVYDDGVYVSYNSYSGEVYPVSWTEEDIKVTKEEWEKIKEDNSCLVLFPIN